MANPSAAEVEIAKRRSSHSAPATGFNVPDMSGLPKATVVRLPRDPRLLEDLQSRDTVSSEELADAAGANAANVRRDLSHLDFHGVRGVGYSVPELRQGFGRSWGSPSGAMWRSSAPETWGVPWPRTGG